MRDRTNVATSAEADYDAKGLLETTQEAIIATREATTQRTNCNRYIEQQLDHASRVIAVRQPDNGGGGNDNNDRGGRDDDPLAQSFVCWWGRWYVFITSLDVFFATKSSTIPVTSRNKKYG